MAPKYEWRKSEKSLYIPPQKPQLVDVPEFKFVTISGQGNPGDELFAKHVGALYRVAYGIKMLPKKALPQPDGYYDFTVYPLEGVWDITDEAKKSFNGTINKDDLVYQIMIRQPDFIDQDFFQKVMKLVIEKAPDDLVKQVSFRSIREGKCIQMLHVGKFDDEPATFKQMEDFATEHHLTRISKLHREVYLSDARRVAPEKLRTVLRFNVK